MEYRIEQTLFKLLDDRKQAIKDLNLRLLAQHPKSQIERKKQRLKQFEQNLDWQINRLFIEKQQQWKNLTQRFERTPLPYQLKELQSLLAKFTQRLEYAIEKRHLAETQHFQALCTKLDGLSPLKILSRGYSITQTKEGKMLTSTHDLKQGEMITTQLKTGKIISQVVDFL